MMMSRTGRCVLCSESDVSMMMYVFGLLCVTSEKFLVEPVGKILLWEGTETIEDEYAWPFQ